jgi:type I restriction enzyme S subunit
MIRGEWLPRNLPGGWRIARVIDHVRLVNGYPFDSALFTGDLGMPLVRIRDLGSNTTEVCYAGEPVPGALIDRGDVLVGMDGDFNVARWAGGKALLNQRVCCLTPHASLDAAFLAFVLPVPLKVINDLTGSTTVKHLSSFDILKIRIPLPPQDEQAKIGRFLESLTGRLDNLLTAKRSLLDMLAEKRTSIIATAVTRGIDPKVRLRDSGVPWLGEIPEHWKIERARWLFRERDVRSESGDEELLTVSHLTGVTPRSEKDVNMFEAETNEGYKLCEPGDLVINTLWAWMGAMGIAPVKGIVSPAYNVYEPGPRLAPAYIDALVRLPVFAQEVTRYSKGVWSSRLRLYPEGFFEVYLPVPPLEEQRAIVAHIARETAKLDAVCAATERTIALLKQRRSALIAAAVTGQLDVGAAA